MNSCFGEKGPTGPTGPDGDIGPMGPELPVPTDLGNTLFAGVLEVFCRVLANAQNNHWF